MFRFSWNILAVIQSSIPCMKQKSKSYLPCWVPLQSVLEILEYTCSIRITTPFPDIKAEERRTHRITTFIRSQGLRYTVGHPKKTLTKSFLNPFLQDVACETGVWTGRERIAVSKLSISSELWENARRNGFCIATPRYCASFSLVRRLTIYPKWTTLARRLRKGNKCAQECDGYVPSLPRAYSLPCTPFMYTPPFPLLSNVFHAGVSRFGQLCYGSWFIEFWPGTTLRLGCTDIRLTCILVDLLVYFILNSSSRFFLSFPFISCQF